MKVLVINPVGHPTWDEADRLLYKRFLPPEIEVDVVSLPRGPLTVESVEAYREAVPLVLEIGKKLFNKYNGMIVNCFLDPGVEELRSEVKGIVLGAGESSLTLAKLYGRPVYILTVGLKSETLDLMWSRIRKLGFEKLVADIIGIPMGVAEIDKNREKAISLLLSTMRAVASKEGNVVFVLGCTGFGGMAEELEDEIKMPVVDPIKASALLITSLLKLTRHYT